MSNKIIPSIETLPVELIHRIFDNLDAETIILLVRPVCRLFRAAVNTYNRHDLDLKLISKSSFYLLCRLVNPQNVISLTLSNDERTTDQIALFLPLVLLRDFTRLRSLTLLHIDESQLNFISKRLSLRSITSLSLNIRKYDNRQAKTTNNLLTSTIAQSNLRKLEFNIKTDRISKMSWPINCTIQYLTINTDKPDNTMNTVITILQCSPYLHTLVVKERSDRFNNNIIPTFYFPTFSSPLCFRQLTSITFENFDGMIQKFESFLALTPSLVYLKLIGKSSMFDGKRWEQFIEINLPQLDKFEFFVEKTNMSKKTSADLELMIASFRTPFWIERKKWFVNGELDDVFWTTSYLYSIPLCKSFQKYQPRSNKNFVSTCAMAKENDPMILDDIKSLHLSLNQALADHIQDKIVSTERMSLC